MKYIKGFLIALLASTVTAKCGPEYGSCPSGQCCSKYGYCGTSEKHCGTGCQSSYGKCDTSDSISTNGRCGSSDGICPDGQCCSKYGYCGNTSAHCDKGCQSAFGKCNTNTTSTKKSSTKKSSTKKSSTKKSSTKKSSTKKSSTKSTTSTKKSSTKKSSTKTTTSTTKKTTTTKTESTSLPTSTNGKCGPEDGHCPSGLCCSKYNYCGTSEKYCDVGCQPLYGICNDNSTTTHTTKKTTTTTTSSSTTKKTTTTTTTTTKTKTNSLPTSTNGRCGPEYGICPNHQCCSKYNYCGSSEEYCEESSGCQSEFGRCGEYISTSKFKFYYQCKDSKHWALTFDDGPYLYDLDLLDFLKEKGVKATFFINGDNNMNIKTEKGKEIVQRMYNEGHIIGSHTWKHVHLPETNKDKIIEEMTKLEDVLMEYIGKKPAFMRPPYGEGDDSEEIAEILEELGYTGGCMWNVDTLDWDKVGDADYALSVFKKRLGKPILSLNHSYYKGITKEILLNITEKEIDFMLENGYTPVTMDVCLGLEPYQN